MDINQEKLNEIIKEALINAASDVWDKLVDNFDFNKSDVYIESNSIDSKVSLLFGENKITFTAKNDYVKHYITDGVITINDSQKGEVASYKLGGVDIKGGQVVSANNGTNFVAYTKVDGIVVEKVEVKESNLRKIEISIEDFGSDWTHSIKTQV